MLKCFELIPTENLVANDGDSSPPALMVELPFDDRKRSRLRTQTRCGKTLGLFLPRGTVLHDGDQLKANSGEMISVVAAPENLSVAKADDALLHARAAYHLGNRHVPLQIGKGWLAFQHDHVLDDMLRLLGLDVTTSLQPFQPEPGAYSPVGQHGHHGHGHGDEGHSHD